MWASKIQSKRDRVPVRRIISLNELSHGCHPLALHSSGDGEVFYLVVYIGRRGNKAIFWSQGK
jgi:hypothetical protein